YSLFFFFFSCSLAPPDLHSFPTRRSSDLNSSASALPPSPLTSWRARRPTSWGNSRWNAEPTPARLGILPSSRSWAPAGTSQPARSEEHTSELQSRSDLVCRLLLEKKKKKK